MSRRDKGRGQWGTAAQIQVILHGQNDSTHAEILLQLPGCTILPCTALCTLYAGLMAYGL